MPDLTDWNPEFASRLNQLKAGLDAAGIKYNIVSGYRSPEYQNQMYQNHLAHQAGRPIPYPNVETPGVVAPPWRSFHNYGLAADFTTPNQADYARIRQMALQYGLTGIGASDPGHIQLAGTLQDDINRYHLQGWRPPGLTGNEPINAEVPAHVIAAPASVPQPAQPLQDRGTHLTPGGAPGAASPDAATHEAFIRDYAAKIGVDPELAVGIAKAEGMNPVGFRSANQASTVDVSGGQPFSFGDYQLNVKGGLGAAAIKAGIDPRDPAQWQKADQFALDYMKKSGIAPWTDPFARQWTAANKPIMGTSLTSTPSGIVDPSIVARGGTSPPIPADASATAGASTPAAPAAPTFGQAIASGDVGGALKAAFTKPTDASGKPTPGGKSPIQSVADAFAKPQGQAAPQIPEMRQAPMPQDPNAGLAGPSEQLFQSVSANAARPLTWSSRPYGSGAGQQMGTTLNNTGYPYSTGYGYG